jgi:hypothetical protein
MHQHIHKYVHTSIYVRMQATEIPTIIDPVALLSFLVELGSIIVGISVVSIFLMHLQVGPDKAHWENGKAIVYDTTVSFCMHKNEVIYVHWYIRIK